MLTTIWRSLKSRSDRFTKRNSRQRKPQQRQSNLFHPCETLEKRQFLSANTIGYTGKAVESLIGTAYVAQPSGNSVTQATETIILSSDNSFLSSIGAQAGTVGAEQLPTVEVDQGVILYQAILPSNISKLDSSSRIKDSFLDSTAAMEYQSGTGLRLPLQVFKAETREAFTLLDISKPETLSFLNTELVSARDTADSVRSSLSNAGTQFIVDDADYDLYRAQLNLDVFQLVTGWGVTYSEQVNLFNQNRSFLDHSSNPYGFHDGDFTATHNGLVVSMENSTQLATLGIQLDTSAVYGADVTQANPLTASTVYRNVLSQFAAGTVPGIDGVYMPPSPSLFESDGMASGFINFSQSNSLQIIDVERPNLPRSISIDLGHNFGPYPVSIDMDVDSITKSMSGIRDEDQTYIIGNVANGKVEKLIDGGWVDVSSPPSSTSPMGLLQALQKRKIQPTDQLRWNQASASGTTAQSFEITGWQKVNKVKSNTTVHVGGTGYSMNTADDPASNIVQNLNNAIKGSASTYTGAPPPASSTSVYSANGLGVIVRQLNDGQDPGTLNTNQQQFLASSIIHNDLNVPNSVYPSTDVSATTADPDGPTGNWATPTLVGIYNLDPNVGFDPNSTSDIWYDEIAKSGASPSEASKFSNARDSSWAWGVFYAHDSNSEQRAVPYFTGWDASNSSKAKVGTTEMDFGNGTYHALTDLLSNQGSPGTWKYVAPGGDIASNKVTTVAQEFNVTATSSNQNTKYSNLGANRKWIGNPKAHLTTGNQQRFGAGAGIHVTHNFGDVAGNKGLEFDYGTSTNTFNFLKDNNLADPYGQLNPYFTDKTNWSELATKLKGASPNWEQRNWLPDLILPWVDNPRDMINLSNFLHENHAEILGQQPDAVYWGWNEIPIPSYLQFPGSDYDASNAYITTNYPNSGGAYPSKLNCLAFVLPQYDSASKVEFEKVSDAISHNSTIYQNVADQLAWYNQQGYLKAGTKSSSDATVILTLLQSTAVQLDNAETGNTSFAKQFRGSPSLNPELIDITDPKVESDGYHWRYVIDGGYLTMMEEGKWTNKEWVKKS